MCNVVQMSSLVGRASTPAVGLQTRLRQTPAALDHGNLSADSANPALTGLLIMYLSMRRDSSRFRTK